MTEVEEKKCDTCGKVYRKESDFLHGTSQWRVCNEGNLWFNCSCSSTIMLAKGKFSWYNPELFLSAESRSVFNHLSGIKDFPHIPTVIMELQSKVLDENLDAKALAQAVRVDPFLATEVLRIASNLKNLRATDRAKIKSLEHSITYIGRKTLSEMLVVASITSFKVKTKVFTINDVWGPALQTGIIAEAIAVRFNPALRSDEVYLAACLCNIGKIVSALCFPELTDEIWKKASGQPPEPWRKAESAHENIDHCILGEIGASIWGLPKYIGEAARLHHTPPTKIEIPKNQATLNDIVHFANLLTPWFHKTKTYCDDNLIVTEAKRFGLNDNTLEDLVNDIRKHSHIA